MKQWSVAVLMTKRLKDGGIELLLVPVFVRADTKRDAMDQAEQCVSDIPGYQFRGCSFVEAPEEGSAHSEGITWKLGSWISMP